MKERSTVARTRRNAAFSITRAAALLAVSLLTLSCGAEQQLINALDPKLPADINQAVITGSRTVRARSMVTLDGTQSENPTGLGVTYEWTLASKPIGSSAALTQTNAALANFFADKGGYYTVTLKVSTDNEAGGQTSKTATATINVVGTGSNHPPVAVIQSTSATGVATLNGTQSYDIDGNPLTYTWTLVSNLTSSQAQLLDSRSAIAYLYSKLDVSYTFAVKLHVTDGIDYDESTATVTIAP